MRDFIAKKISLNLTLAILIPILAISGFSYGLYRYDITKKSLTAELNQTREKLSETIKDFQMVIEDLENNIENKTNENRDLNDFLTIIKARNTDYQNQMLEKDLTVSKLKKYIETDKELLQKYSKIYFLNENYVPSELAGILTKFLFRSYQPEEIHAKVRPYLESLVSSARSEGIDLSILSGYRSFGTQAAIKARNTVIYGAESTNRFSADQGYSEHQLGTTVDFTTSKTGTTLDDFESTPAYVWLLQNAYRYGFILSYPINNNYYIFEPWHWRFVGTSLAEYLHAQKKNFYDLEQRDIDPYLEKIFD